SLATAIAKCAAQPIPEYRVVVDDKDDDSIACCLLRTCHISCQEARASPCIPGPVGTRMRVVRHWSARRDEPGKLPIPCRCRDLSSWRKVQRLDPSLRNSFRFPHRESENVRAHDRSGWHVARPVRHLDWHQGHSSQALTTLRPRRGSE